MSAVSAGEQERTEATEDARTRDPPPQSMSMLGSESSTGCARDVAEGAPSPLGSSETPSANSASLPLAPRPPKAQRKRKARRIRITRPFRCDVVSTAPRLRKNRVAGQPPRFRVLGGFRGYSVAPSPLRTSRSRSFSSQIDAAATRDFAAKQKAALTPARGALSFALFRTTRVARSHCPVAQWQSR